MQAIILAAGMGKRLKKLTEHHTKCMVEVNGEKLIKRMLTQLDAFAFKKIVIVVGYYGKKLKEYVLSLNINSHIEFIENPIYDKTNNIYSLYLAKDVLCQDDTILLESDLIFDNSVLELLINDDTESLALVDSYKSWMDGTCVKLSDDDRIEQFIAPSQYKFDDIGSYYKTVNIYKFGKDFSTNYYVPFLEAYCKALGKNEYYEQVLRCIVLVRNPSIKAKKLNGQRWYEIDDLQDLRIASSIFSNTPEEKLYTFQNCYGGYWRYPNLLDYCYLVNPFFPPQQMLAEIKASYVDLLQQYPSGIEVNSFLAARMLDIPIDYTVVGNGASELIKSLFEILTGSVGIIEPTFQEYIQRNSNKRIVKYSLANRNNYINYSSNDIIDFYGKNEIENLVIINPDNPSGNYIPHTDMLDLLAWAKTKSIKLIIDESFIDFSNEKKTLLSEDILNEYDNLFVIKSISKSYGVPGLRLGVLCSSRLRIIKNIKENISIWNINSFAEFFMQIMPKYNRHYEYSLNILREERERFIKELCKIEWIKIYPSQANFIIANIDLPFNSKEICERLLFDHNILIKNLSNKMNGQSYIRISIRSPSDNDTLISALKSIKNN